MTLSVKHAHTAGGVNDPTKEVSKDRWNADHTIAGIGAGSAFPGSPATGDQFFRTDLGLDCYYDGTRWLTKQQFHMAIGGSNDHIAPITSNPAIPARFPVRNDYSLWLERFVFSTLVLTNNTSANYWTVALAYTNTANTQTTITSANTQSDSTLNWVQHDVAINAEISAAARQLQVNCSKTGAPGSLYAPCAVVYRLIVT